MKNTVGDLIEKLKKCDPGSIVYLEGEDGISKFNGEIRELKGDEVWPAMGTAPLLARVGGDGFAQTLDLIVGDDG